MVPIISDKTDVAPRESPVLNLYRRPYKPLNSRLGYDNNGHEVE